MSSESSASMSDAGSLSRAGHDESPAEIVERYDDWAIGYEADVRSWGYTLPEDLADQLVACHPVGRVLDAGCGTGLIGHALVERGVSPDRLIGIDASPTSLAIAADAGVYLDVSCVDLSAGLPFDDNAFGGVICGGVLTYIPDADPVVREFVRVTRPGGSIVLSQRTDMWVERRFDDTLGQLRAQGLTVEVGERVPYLPDLDDYGTEIEVVYTTISGIS